MDATLGCPYVMGKKIDLKLNGRVQVRATILHVYGPFNTSCTMNILFDTDLSELGIQGKVVLKLFDRRYATGLRSISGAIPWTQGFETRYSRMITNGTPAMVQSHLIKRLRAFDENLNEPRSIDRVNHENCFQVFCEVAFCGKMRNCFDKELEAYSLLEDLQGHGIPRLITQVALVQPEEFPRPATPQCLEVPGLILQYNEGFPLAVFPRHVPMNLWGIVIEQTTEMLRELMDRGVLFQPMCADNILVNMDVENDSKIELCFLNFVHCKFLGDCADETEWKESIASFWQSVQSL